MTPAPLSGRKAQAALNDERILAAAREVFTEDPGAPIAAVAARAGVGISALYRRYASKEELLRKLCGDGLRRYIEEAEAALATHGDPWEAFVDFMHRNVDADTSTLTLSLAGTFTPSPDLYRDAERASQLGQQLFERTKAAGAIRDDVEVNDISFLLEQVAAVKVRDDARTHQLRHRYLTLSLDALHAPAATALPGPAPTWEEVSGRWDAS